MPNIAASLTTAGHHASQPAAEVRTIASWLNALLSGADPLPALQQTRSAALQAAALKLWIHLCPAAAWDLQISLLQSRLADPLDRPALLNRYPLLGVPFAVKDNIHIAGQPTTAACPAWTRTAAHSASVVQRLLDAGALWVGKTNLDQFATGLVGTRSPYGRPACVADASRISGGSSSGSALTVARGIVPFSLGTDTAGSGRVPAGFNGLVGMKPTPGRVSTAGVVPACRSLDCVSVLAHTVEDAAHVLALIEGPDAQDAYSSFEPGPAALPPVLRIGVPRQVQVDAGCGYDRAWAAALGTAAKRGHRLVEIDFAPLHDVAALLYEGPWVAERHAACREIFDTQPQAMDPAVRRVVERADQFSATQAFEAQYRLRELQAALAPLWGDVDVLMVPTAPIHPRFADVDADPLGVNAQLGIYTNFVNLLGWCALALPAGHTAGGLPFGITLIARGGFDTALADAGLRWLGTGERHALLRWPASEPTLALAVVGAHLSGLPLNGQLLERGARLVESTRTAPVYRLFALPGTTPPKPGLQRCNQTERGHAITVEVWALPLHAVGSFLALIPPPLGLGSVQLADGRHVHGFVCEAHALTDAQDISSFGGWRPYLDSLKR